MTVVFFVFGIANKWILLGLVFMTEGKGTLYLCATPIGNLEDITLRVLRVLREADLIAAEDTRHTRKLLSHFDIHTPMTSYHRHNHKTKSEYLLRLLSEGRSIALVSDAGVPGISDPGADLAAAAISRQLPVVPLPGASAGITALVISGLPTDAFVFEGFLPTAKKSRRDKLQSLSSEQRPIILYEAPHRLVHVLEDILEICGDGNVSVSRELTKKHEETIRGAVTEVLDHFRYTEPRGEFCVVLQNPTYRPVAMDDMPRARPAEHVALLEKEGMPRKEAIRVAAQLYGLSRREVYRLVLDDKDNLPD